MNNKKETEKVIEYKNTIMEMRNIFENQERVIEEMILAMLHSKEKNQSRRSMRSRRSR